jgi:hypothetical protein
MASASVSGVQIIKGNHSVENGRAMPLEQNQPGVRGMIRMDDRPFTSMISKIEINPVTDPLDELVPRTNDKDLPSAVIAENARESPSARSSNGSTET